MSLDSPSGKQQTTAENLTVTLSWWPSRGNVHATLDSAVPLPQDEDTGLNWSPIPNEIRTSSAVPGPRFRTTTL